VPPALFTLWGQCPAKIPDISMAYTGEHPDGLRLCFAIFSIHFLALARKRMRE
jgi:hypothetical protein